MVSKVKPRSYDASRRRQLAASRRERVLDAAEDLFRARGYVGATVAAVAGAAEVSVETVYKSFGGKAGLVRALHARALLGEGAEPAGQRSNALRSVEDPHVLLRGWADLAAEVAPRVGPIHLLVRDATVVDPRIRSVRTGLDDARLRRMRENAEVLESAGWLRPGITVQQAADLLWSVSSPEMFELLVIVRGWDLAAYGDWVYATLAGGLLAQ